jgi:hypothetical protein
MPVYPGQPPLTHSPGSPKLAQRPDRSLYEGARCVKCGRGVTVRGKGRGGELDSTLYRPIGSVGSRFYGCLAPVAHLRVGRLCGQIGRGACRSEGLITGEHVPDRLGEAAGDVDLGDLGAALPAKPGLRALVPLSIDRVAAGIRSGLDQRPSQVLRSGVG